MVSPAAKAVRPERRGKDALPSPVDLEHLDRQTFGDADLQRQVLTLFRRHLADQIGRLKAARTVDERREVAHALVGAARGVGAFPVADLASAIEQASGLPTETVAALDRAAGAAQDFIASYLSE